MCVDHELDVVPDTEVKTAWLTSLMLKLAVLVFLVGPIMITMNSIAWCVLYEHHKQTIFEDLYLLLVNVV